MPEFPPATFNIVNLGCKVNRVEADAVQAALLSAGSKLEAQERADVIIVNTCTVTGEADKKARKAVRHALAANPHARVVVTGCAVAIDPDTYRALGDGVEVIQRADLLVKTSEAAKGQLLRMGSGFHTRVNIKVQDGCDHACTYCIVHVARGKATSTPADQVLREARTYLENGAKELVLTGIDLASYRDGSVRLHGLLELLLDEVRRTGAHDGIGARLRASSIEPHTVDERFIDLLAASDGMLCRHVHMPLQSGSSKVLREMARHYDAEGFCKLVRDMRERVPQLSLTTDVIVGFPGETDDDFEQTLEVVRACGFSKVHVFPYSRREGTPAAQRPDQIDPTVKAQRAARLRELSEELRRQDYDRRIGTLEYAIVEDDCALTESYHEIPIPEGATSGELVPVVLESQS